MVGKMQTQAPTFDLPEPGTLSKFAGNNWGDASFKAGGGGKKQTLVSVGGVPQERAGRGYAPISVLKAEPPPVDVLDSFAQSRLGGSEPTTANTTAKWLTLDDKKLQFEGYFIEGSVRPIALTFFPADRTIMVLEGKTPNGGFKGGKLLKRHVVEGVGLENLNVGRVVEIYGKKFFLTGCDRSTRNFLENLNVHVPDPTPIPEDPEQHASHRFGARAREKPGPTIADRDLKLSFELAAKGRVLTHSIDDVHRTQRFLSDDGRVLSFTAVWDDRKNPNGELRRMEVRVYLCDGTIEVLERLAPNAGRDPSRAFAARRRLPRDPDLQRDRCTTMAPPALPEEAHYQPEDLYIGGNIQVFGRTLTLVDCDPFTRYWYETNVGELQPAIPVEFPSGRPTAIANRPPPPHNGFGSEDDSLGNTKSLVLKPPRPDLRQAIKYGDATLRYTMVFADPKNQEEADRRFILTYHLSDDSLLIHEVAQRNTGQMGGRFLRRGKVKKLKGEGRHSYYHWTDFYIMAVVNINSYIFRLVSADKPSLQFLRENGVDTGEGGAAADGGHTEEPMAEVPQAQGVVDEGTYDMGAQQDGPSAADEASAAAAAAEYLARREGGEPPLGGSMGGEANEGYAPQNPHNRSVRFDSSVVG